MVKLLLHQSWRWLDLEKAGAAIATGLFLDVDGFGVPLVLGAAARPTAHPDILVANFVGVPSRDVDVEDVFNTLSPAWLSQR